MRRCSGNRQSGIRIYKEGKMEPSQITDWCHEIIRIQAPAGGLYVDATIDRKSVVWERVYVLV